MAIWSERAPMGPASPALRVLGWPEAISVLLEILNLGLALVYFGICVLVYNLPLLYPGVS